MIRRRRIINKPGFEAGFAAKIRQGVHELQEGVLHEILGVGRHAPPREGQQPALEAFYQGRPSLGLAVADLVDEELFGLT